MLLPCSCPCCFGCGDSSDDSISPPQTWRPLPSSPSLLLQRLRDGSPRALDAQLVADAWAAHRRTARLVMFYVEFLRRVGCPDGSTLERQMNRADAFYGCPQAALGGRFQQYVLDIMKVHGSESWGIVELGEMEGREHHVRTW